MTRAEMITRLERWQQAHDRLDQNWKAVAKTFCVSMAESPVWIASWAIFEDYTATLGDMLGDPGGDWLEWFCYENDMGRKGHDAGYDGRMAPIETLGDLADLIIEGRERG